MKPLSKHSTLSKNDVAQTTSKKTRKPRPMTRKIAQALKKLSLSKPEKSFLGSEKELMATLGASRPTFRQAVNLLEHQGLLSIGRGVKGGIYSQRPNIVAVIESAALFLMTQETTLSELWLTTDTMMIEAVKLAALCNDDHLHREAVEMLARFRLIEHEAQTLAAFEEDEMSMIMLICRMSKSPPVDLLLRVLYSVGVTAFPPIFDGREDLMQYRRTARIKLLKAIADRDPKLAVRVTSRNAEVSRSAVGEALLKQRMLTMTESEDDWF
jgi:DNA-binding FadR family transcriptional regulator